MSSEQYAVGDSPPLQAGELDDILRFGTASLFSEEAKGGRLTLTLTLTHTFTLTTDPIPNPHLNP